MLTITRCKGLSFGCAALLIAIAGCGDPDSETRPALTGFEEITVPTLAPADSASTLSPGDQTTTPAPNHSVDPMPDGIVLEELIGKTADLWNRDPDDGAEVPRRLGLPDGYVQYSGVPIDGDQVGGPEAMLLAIKPGPVDNVSAHTELLVLVRLTDTTVSAVTGGTGSMYATVVAVVAVRVGEWAQLSTSYGCRDTNPDADKPSNARLLIGIVYVGVGAEPQQRTDRAWAVTVDAITPIEDPSTLVCEIVTGD